MPCNARSRTAKITIALIYKFMDDMDAESEELGGSRKFFAGEFARYGWAKLMRSGLGGHETLNLYAEAIAKMPEKDEHVGDVPAPLVVGSGAEILRDREYRQRLNPCGEHPAATGYCMVRRPGSLPRHC